MSKPVDKYVWQNTVMSKHGPESAITRAVLIAISLHMKADGTGAWPSQELVEERTAAGLRSVKRHLKIADGEWIERTLVRAKGSKWPRTEYGACVPDRVYDLLPERPWESDPMFRHGATVAPRPNRKGRKTGGMVPIVQTMVPMDADHGARECKSMVPERHTNSSSNYSKNSSKEGALARTARSVLKTVEAKTETEAERVQRMEQARRKAIDDIARLQANGAGGLAK